MNDTKIYLVTYTEYNETYHRVDEFVSHGIGNNTLNNYVLPNEPVGHFNPKQDIEGWYISNEDD